MSLAYARETQQQLRYSFGPFTIDVDRRVVLRAGIPIRLTLKCVELLIALAGRAGQTLTKEDLIEAAWHDPSASDATLAQHVFLLRRALGDEGSAAIETVTQVGYRFAAPVRVEGGRDRETVRAFSRGARTFRSLMTQQGLQSAIDLYTRVIELDDSRADAYAARAECSRLLAQYMYAEPLACLSAARHDALDAFARDPHSADALVECAYAAALFDRDLQAAGRYLAQAAEASREHPEVITLQVSLPLMRGDLQAARAAAATRSGPLLGAVLYLARDFTQARVLLEQRAGDSLVRLLLGACSLLEGNVAAAETAFEALYREEVDLTAAGQPNVRHYALAFLIFAQARSGNISQARRGVVDLARLGRERYVSPMARAIAHAGLGEIETAVSFVEEAVSRVDPWSAHIAVDPLLDALRADERFGRLVQTVAGSRRK